MGSIMHLICKWNNYTAINFYQVVTNQPQKRSNKNNELMNQMEMNICDSNGNELISWTHFTDN